MFKTNIISNVKSDIFYYILQTKLILSVNNKDLILQNPKSIIIKIINIL